MCPVPLDHRGKPLVPLPVELPSESEVEQMFASGQYEALGVVCGAVSGGLEAFCIGNYAIAPRMGHGIFDDLQEAAVEAGLAELLQRIQSGYSELIPGGLQLLYRCEAEAESQILAQQPATARERKLNPQVEVHTLFSTLGKGEVIAVAPGKNDSTHGDCGLLHGGVDTVATITPDERSGLHDLARRFDKTKNGDG